MDARLQRRVQRYGWDLAADSYEDAWGAPLAPAQATLLALADLAPGKCVLDVACGTGLVAFEAARRLGPAASVLGVDLSARMVAQARQRSDGHTAPAGTAFARMDAEALDLPDGGFDVVLCALGLMYMPEPEQALREMHRVLRPGGQMVAAVWGERQACGWAEVFPIVDAEVASDVCPLFFRLGTAGALALACREAGFEVTAHERVSAYLPFPNPQQACDAAFSGGPVALAWNRFSDAVKERVRARYLASIAPWQRGAGYAVPGEFVVVAARKAGLSYNADSMV